MRRTLIAAIAMSGCAAAIAQQAPDAGAWVVRGDRATVTVSGISLPIKAGSTSLVRTMEASQKGKGLDNVAQYQSADSAVQATVYIFYSTYADTALATWATDRAIRQRYGPDVTLVSDAVSAVAGVKDAATRRIYDKAMLTVGQPVVTAASFIRAGSWLVGLRVTGPADRRDEVESALDAFLSGAQFGKELPMRSMPLRIAPPCAPGPEKPAKYLSAKNAAGMAFFSSLIGGSMALADKDTDTIEKEPQPLAFPGNGASPLCVRGTIVSGEVRNDILQPANNDDGQIMLVPIDDAGGILAIEPALLGDGFVVKRYGIASTEVMGSFKTVPSVEQIGAILSGKDRKAATVQSRTVFTPDGNSRIEVNPDTLK
jgi:hypothetical protein